ncbi:MAG TPA: transglutaminase domain-containing protein [Polyangiaceae bacterium]
MRLRGSLPRLFLALGVALVAPRSLADGPVLHEFIPSDPNEDLTLRATTPDGRMAAAVSTPTGAVPAPGERTERPEVAYGGSSTPDSVDASYRIDPDTTRPDVVSYDEPFVPAVTPFKRLYAYDSVDERGELVVSDRRLRRMDVGGTALSSEDQFYGDLFVDVVPGVPVRVPSVAPQARILAARVEPQAPIELVRDGADNWFLMGSARQRLRLVVQLAAARAVFGSPFPDVSRSVLTPHAPTLPPDMKRAADDVIQRIGLSTSVRPRDALTTLVEYFRAFAPSDERPKTRAPAELYQELALSKKGVCRHRAFAFVVTALGLGMPARLVRNEAHAWVEAFDGSIWHRIDLGGAAGRFELDSARDVPLYGGPEDPFAWPAGSQSTQSAFEALTSGGGQPSPGGSGSAATAPAPAPPAAPASSAEPAARSVSSDRPEAAVELEVSGAETRRGATVRVRGAVSADGETCPFARVDVALRGSDGRRVPLGSVPTDARGRFDTELTVPLQADVGEYRVVAATPGAGACGASP